MSTFWEMMITAVTIIGTVAIVSVVVSKKSQTPQVIQASGSAFSNALGVAESPVTGAQYHIDLSYPGTDFTGSFGAA
jgi:hypothetical protein